MTCAPEKSFRIDCAFPGGNIVVDKIDGQHVFIRQDLRGTSGWWFYWCCRVRGAEGRTLDFHFTDGAVIGVRGPAVSLDGGQTWSWLGIKTVKNNSAFKYRFQPDDKEVRFSFGMPYQARNLREFIARYRGNPHLRVGVLCGTKKGRKVEQLRLGCLQGQPRRRVLIACRHHCCEMMASYALEGILATVLGDNDVGRWLRENVEFLMIPFMDKDGVEDGDQGKNRKPRDHGRDYQGQSVHLAVKKLRAFTPKWSHRKLKIALDLHCPHIRGHHAEEIYLVGSSWPGIWRQQRVFSKILESVQAGPLVFRTKNNLPYGRGWNKDANWTNGKSFAQWAAVLPGIKLATGIEIPYANVGGKEVNAETARAFGRDLAEAMRVYLETEGSKITLKLRNSNTNQEDYHGLHG